MFVSAALLSIFSYIQSIGAVFTFPDIDLPPAIVDTFSSFSDFFSTVQKIVTIIPEYDIRFQLCIMIFIIPFLLNFFLHWVAFPTYRTLLYLLDVAAAFISLLFLSLIILNKFKVVYIIFLIVGVLYLIFRITLFFAFKEKNQIKLPDVCKNICNHFLYGFVPRLKLSMTLNQINRAIHRYALVTEIRPIPLNPFTEILLMVGAAIFIAFSIWCCGAFHLVVELPVIVRYLFPWVGFPFGLFFFVLFFIRLFKKGRQFIFHCKQFILKWGQITIFVLLTSMYIPVLLSVGHHFMSSKSFNCPSGQYRRIIPSHNNSLDYLLYTDSICSPCDFNNPNVSDSCPQLCNAYSSYLYKQPSYEFTENVLKISGALMVFGLVGFMIGIPLAWFLLIFSIRKFLINVNVFGKDPQDKWARLMERMTSSGILLIRPFKFKFGFWPLIYFLLRLLIVVFTLCLARVSKYMIIVPMAFNLIVIIFELIFKPYLHKTNLIFNIVLLSSSILFSIFPVISSFGVSLASILAAPLFIIALLIPIVAFIILYIKREKYKFESDPTYPKSVPRDLEELYEKHRQMAMEERQSKQKSALNSDVNESNFGATDSMHPRRTYRRYNRTTRSRRRKSREYSYSYSYSYPETPDTPVRTKTRTGRRHKKTARDSQQISELQNEAELQNRDVGQGNAAPLPLDVDSDSSEVESLKLELELKNVDVGEGKGGKDQPVPIQETAPEYDYYSDYGYYSDGYYPYDDYPYYDDDYDYYDYYCDEDPLRPRKNNKAELLPSKKGKKKKKKKKNAKSQEEAKKGKPKKKGRPEKIIIKYDSNGKKYIIHRRMYTFLRERFDEGDDEFIEQEKFERLKKHNKEELYCWIEEDCYTLHTGDLATINEALKQQKLNKVAPDEETKIKAYTINYRLLGKRVSSMYEMFDIIIHGATVERLSIFHHVFLLLASAAAGWYVGGLLAYDAKFDRLPICG